MTGKLQYVPGLGAEAADFAGFVQGNIAVIDRGEVYFGTKINNAEDAGASGVLIVNTSPSETGGLFPGSFAVPAEDGGPIRGTQTGKQMKTVPDVFGADLHLTEGVTREFSRLNLSGSLDSWG